MKKIKTFLHQYTYHVAECEISHNMLGKIGNSGKSWCLLKTPSGNILGMKVYFSPELRI